MSKTPQGRKINIFAQLSLRKRFAFGLGLMLMPFFILAGSSFFIFDQAISRFEDAENEMLEERFPLADLKHFVSKARPTVDALLIEPEKIDRRERLKNLDISIKQKIKNISSSPSNSPEKYGLLKGIGDSWDSVYGSAMAYPDNLELDGLPPNEQTLARSSAVDQIHQDLDEALRGIDTIEIKLAQFQTSDNLQRARELKEQERFLIGFITLAAISIALISAIWLSRSVLRSMQILVDGLEELSEGSLEKRIVWSNSDEFGRLAAAINYMAEKLAQSQQALIESATLDGLTGVFNRREFNRLLTIEVERSRRTTHPVSMVMVDIDHFKSINDTYGHQSGDDALQWVAQLLSREIRPGDIVSRYGGEEFALILPNTASEDAGIVAERIRQKMESELVPIQENLTISVTASLGCATFPVVGDSETMLMSAADKALYQAKETGRNRVCYAQRDVNMIEQSADNIRTEQSALM